MSVFPRNGSEDPEPYQNEPDTQHCFTRYQRVLTDHQISEPWVSPKSCSITYSMSTYTRRVVYTAGAAFHQRDQSELAQVSPGVLGSDCRSIHVAHIVCGNR